jgi:tagatose 6-phosphate kinase
MNSTADRPVPVQQPPGLLVKALSAAVAKFAQPGNARPVGGRQPPHLPRVPKNGSVIVTVTLNAALNVSYEAAGVTWDGVNPVPAPRHQAGGRGVMVARVLHIFGHDVVAAGLAGGATGEMIRADLAAAGIPAEFTPTGRESRRILQVTDTLTGRSALFPEAGPYITTEELGRFASEYRQLLRDATAVVLCGSLPAGLPPEIYGTLATYASDLDVPVIVDAGGAELRHAVARRPALVVPDPVPEPAALLAAGAGAVVLPSGDELLAVTSDGRWRAWVPPDPGRPDPGAQQEEVRRPAARGALVAGLVPGVLLGWSWPDRLRHALALSASATATMPAGPAASAAAGPGTGPRRAAGPDVSSTAAQPAPVDLALYERFVGQVHVDRG